MAARLDEADGQAAWCQQPGAATVLATAEQLASLHSRLDPVTAAMAQDPATGGSSNGCASSTKGPSTRRPGPVGDRRRTNPARRTWSSRRVTRACSTAPGGWP